jgi:FkbM family methyltransferase
VYRIGDMRAPPTDATASQCVTFNYEGTPITIDLPTSNEHMGRAIREYQTFYERDVLEACREVLRHEHAPFAVVDVGAFCGNHTTYFAKFCGASWVIACEPTATSFAALTRTLVLNGVAGCVGAYPVAVGDRVGQGTMLGQIPGNSGGNRFSHGSGDVPVTTLDHLMETELPRSLRLSLIKIDVEGLEIPVLRGGIRTIATHRPWLCIELMSATHLRSALEALPVPYVIVDWLGWSPTWLLRPLRHRSWRIRIVNAGWCMLASVRIKRIARPYGKFASWLLRRDPQLLNDAW